MTNERKKSRFIINDRIKIYVTDCVSVGIAESIGVEAEISNKSCQSDIRFLW